MPDTRNPLTLAVVRQLGATVKEAERKAMAAIRSLGFRDGAVVRYATPYGCPSYRITGIEISNGEPLLIAKRLTEGGTIAKGGLRRLPRLDVAMCYLQPTQKEQPDAK